MLYKTNTLIFVDHFFSIQLTQLLQPVRRGGTRTRRNSALQFMTLGR
jgi:hypothetical protein